MLEKESAESLAKMVICPQILKDYPLLEKIMEKEIPSISTLHYISGNALFLFIGTEQGKLWGIPLSMKTGSDLVLVC